MNPIITFFKRPAPEQLIWIETALWLGIARLAIRALPFRLIAPLLGKHMEETEPSPISSQNRHLIACMERAIERMSVHLPWECKCLAQAITAKTMLKRRRIQSTLYLGVTKEDPQGLSAHAWLRCGDKILTGRKGMDRFKVISYFSS